MRLRAVINGALAHMSPYPSLPATLSGEEDRPWRVATTKPTFDPMKSLLMNRRAWGLIPDLHLIMAKVFESLEMYEGYFFAIWEHACVSLFHDS